MSEEHVDAIVVGARCAGSAAATALARAGRRVVAVDAAKFPSTTISTHLLFAGGVAELARVGALERVEALGAPRHDEAYIGMPGAEVQGTYSPVDGIAYGMCVRRAGLDLALVETARAAGADVREGVKVTSLVEEDGRVAGVRVSARGTQGEHTLRAPLVIGADGRRSTVARLVGASEHLSNPERAGVLLRVLRGPADRVARHGRDVARGPRTRHRLPDGRRPGAEPADAAEGAGGRIPAGPGRRVRPHGGHAAGHGRDAWRAAPG
ncbi:NAD(P)/FAD-dependent oxidoreductase [Yinghuangia aomiensis]